MDSQSRFTSGPQVSLELPSVEKQQSYLSKKRSRTIVSCKKKIVQATIVSKLHVAKNSSNHNCILQKIVQGSFSSFHSRELHGHQGSAQWKTVDKRLWSPAYQFPLSALCCSFATFELDEQSSVSESKEEDFHRVAPFLAIIARMNICFHNFREEHLLP